MILGVEESIAEACCGAPPTGYTWAFDCRPSYDMSQAMSVLRLTSLLERVFAIIL